MRRRTIIMLVLTVLCGLGLGILASFGNGFYTAICLFMYPYLSALMFLFISIDIANPPQEAKSRVREAKSLTVNPARRVPVSVMESQRQARI